MSFLDAVKITIVEFIRPGTAQQLGENNVLKQMYQNSNAGAIQPNTWYRLHNQTGSCVGFSYSCNCRQEYQMLSAFEWLRDYACQQCGCKFDLLKHVGIKNEKDEFKIKPEEWESFLAKLPVRPRLAGVPEKPRAVDTWSASDETVEWVGTAPGQAGW